MTDIEKKAYKVTLIRAASIAIFLIITTWQAGGWVRDMVSGIANLKSSIDQLVRSNNDHNKRDSVTNVILAKNTRDIDSLKKVKCCVMAARRKRPAKTVVFYTEMRDKDGNVILKKAYNN